MSSAKGTLIGKTISQLKGLLAAKEVSAAEVLASHIDQIEAHEGDIKAFLSFSFDKARGQAEDLDKNFDFKANSTEGVLAGIPVAIKDNMCAIGTKTTCGSKILENFVAPYDAQAVVNLQNSGALILGKTNLDEFAMGSSTENSAYQRTKNPFDTAYVPGGSSGGSAAAVAAGFATSALGSDTGGSIRQPASFCGVVGMKPTYGTVSRYGLVAFASSLDQIGPFGRTVEDVALTLLAISGHDSKDSTSLKDPYTSAANSKNFPQLTLPFIQGLSQHSSEELLKGTKIGVIKELIGDGIEDGVRDSILSATKLLTSLGAQVEEVSIPHAKYALPVYYILATAEASANLARFDGVRYGLRDLAATDILSMYNETRQAGFGAEVKLRIMLGTYALSSGYYDAYYKKAQQVRRLITSDFDKIFANYDLVLSPTAPSTAFKFDEKTGDPLQMYLSDIATIPANLAGLPGISLPCGLAAAGSNSAKLPAKLPVGLQLLGAPLSDAVLIKVAYAFEQALKLDSRAPMLTKVLA
ncbi:MAG: Asp-tRNA(Asn)/Glu-tRNA(Gln) amidotransferase subunit GatA [Candidatus Obscuribacterales bacterium]